MRSLKKPLPSGRGVVTYQCRQCRCLLDEQDFPEGQICIFCLTDQANSEGRVYEPPTDNRAGK